MRNNRRVVTDEDARFTLDDDDGAMEDPNVVTLDFETSLGDLDDLPADLRCVGNCCPV
jgi:hypothetical protein